MMAQMNGIDLGEGDMEWTDEMLASFAEQEEEEEEDIHSINDALE